MASKRYLIAAAAVSAAALLSGCADYPYYDSDYSYRSYPRYYSYNDPYYPPSVSFGLTYQDRYWDGHDWRYRDGRRWHG